MTEQSSYLNRPAVISIILGSFFVFTLPFSIFALLQAQPADFARASFIFFLVLGSTHFLVTFAFFMQNQNLRHFYSSATNKIIYFLIPALIFFAFNSYHRMQVAVFHPQFDFWFVSGIRFFNFYHFGRQSFGVMQLFKRRAGLNFPAKFESAYFNILILLLMTTFLSGGYLVSPWLLLVPGVLLLGIIKSYLKAGSAAIFPLTYLLLQSISAGFAVYSTALYIFALGMHYVEYQVLMYPRVFSTTLETTGIDRIYSVFRSSKWVFYLVLLMAAAVFSITAQSAGDAAASGTSLSLFDALFVFHFFIESFVWKFSNPYYRKQLQQLYF